tara:strand:+ start:481 stop:1074 length:594 start_codon:yes stop_codon:yes gene_type:complete
MEEDQPLCLICHDFIDTENNYTLPECKHKYHTKCIIEWFKKGDNRCPYCQNRGINNEGINNHWFSNEYYNKNLKIYFYPSWRNKKWYDEETKKRYQMGVKKLNKIKKYVNNNNNNNIPNWIKRELNLLSKEEKIYKNLLKELKEFKKTINSLPYEEACSKKRQLQNITFNKQKKICNIKNNIISFPYYSIIIPITNI